MNQFKQFEVTNAITIRAESPADAGISFLRLVFVDPGEGIQVVRVFPDEVKPLIAALTEAAVWLADQVSAEAT